MKFNICFIASTRAFDLLTRAFNLPTRAFSLSTRAFSVLTREFELVTRGFEPVTRGFELVTRVLLFHKQNLDHQAMFREKEKASTECSKSIDMFEEIVSAQWNLYNVVRTVTITDNSFIAFAYTKSNLMITIQCVILTRHIVYAKCGSHRNKRLFNSRSVKHPVFLRPVMIHFTKDKSTFMSFALKILALDAKPYEMRRIGVDMESVLCNGFKNDIPSISRLACV